MITILSINPPVPSPGNTVCVTFEASGSGTPSVLLNPLNGGPLIPLQPQLHPGSTNRWVVCFTWPNTSAALLTIKQGSDHVSVAIKAVT